MILDPDPGSNLRAPNLITRVLVRQTKERLMQHQHGDVATNQRTWEPPGAEAAGKMCPHQHRHLPEPLREHSPAETSVWDVWPPGLWENTFQSFMSEDVLSRV